MSFRPWLFLPAKLAHDLAPIGLELAQTFSNEVARGELASVGAFEWSRKNRVVRFRNPLGIAGGVDKDGLQISGWQHFGAGFVEIGTVTPKPQLPNPGKIIDRDNLHEALWNRMGFPGRGAHFALQNLREWRWHERPSDLSSPPETTARFPIFINIGKQRETPLDEATQDYLWLIDFFCRPQQDISGAADIDAFVINISSPNTKGLREIFERERLAKFLGPIVERLNHWGVPGLLKLSPDMDSEIFKTAVETAVNSGLDGFVATNTTAARPPGLLFPTDGGLSGRPLASPSRAMLSKLVEQLGPNRGGLLIVSAGGVLDGAEVLSRLEIGADLVQTYSGLVFHGPKFFEHALRDLASCVTPRRPLL